MMSRNYTNLDFVDSAQAALKETLRRPGRLTDADRATLEVEQALEQYDYAEALELADVAIGQFPEAWGILMYRAAALEGLGKTEKQFDTGVRQAELMPFGPGQIQYSNEFNHLPALGRGICFATPS